VSELGVHFAITDSQAAALRAAKGDDAAVIARIEEIEEAWDDAWIAESDTAWDALPDAARDGEHLLAARDVAILIDPARVTAAAEALAMVDESLEDVRALFGKAARAGRHILFSVWM
jgi:hypothetical protein